MFTNLIFSQGLINVEQIEHMNFPITKTGPRVIFIIINMAYKIARIPKKQNFLIILGGVYEKLCV